MHSLALYLVTSALLIITPGPDVLYVLMRGIAGGRRAGLMSALGVSLGTLVHTTTAALGLSVLLTASIWAFWVLKIGGGAYLVYVGYRLLRSRKSLVIEAAQGSLRSGKCLAQGFISNVLNPKVAVFFLAFLPQFASEGPGRHPLQMVELGLLFASMTAAFLFVLGFFSGEIGRWLNEKPRFQSGIQIGAGSALALLGIRMILPDRK